MATRRDEILAKLRGTPDSPGEGAPTGSQLEAFQRRTGERIQKLRDDLMGVDRRFDRSGIPDFTFRADFSRMDTREEREQFLAKQVGPKGFTRDRFGNYALTPQGMDTLQLPHSDKPVLIDEPEVTRFDVADLRGDAPAIAGATLAGIFTGGLGFVAGAGAVAGGAAAAKGIDEAADAFRGDNLQSPGEIAADLGREAAFAAGGETFSRAVVLPIGRRLLAPEAKRMTPEAAQLAEDAFEIGAKPNVSQITRAPILGRTQSMMNRIFGDPNAFQNSRALGMEMERLARESGEKIAKRTDLGELIKENVRAARRAFSADSAGMYQLFDDVVGGRPIIPTARLKAVAEDILQTLPRTTQGRAVLTAPETSQQIGGVLQLPDFITGKQMQALRSRLLDASRVNNLVPGVEARHARLLHRAANQAFGDTEALTPEFIARHFNVDLGSEAAQKAFGDGGPEQLVQNAVDSLRRADDFYRKGVAQFDNDIISRITRDPSFAGSIDPESIIDITFRKGRATNVKRVMDLLPDNVRGNVRNAAMTDLLDTMRDGTADPLNVIFNGKRFLDTLDSYGDETLDAMFGVQRRQELRRLGKVTQLVTQRQAMSGGLVAAHIALHPLRNFSRLVQLRIMSRVMNSDNGLRWLTVGLEAPKTREGAAALSRLSAQIMAIGEDETQEVNF